MKALKEKSTNFKRKKIIWVSFLILDVYLHKTSRIEILRHLAKKGHTVYLIAVRSRKKYELQNSNIHVISAPLRYLPVISPLLFLGILMFLLPYYIVSIDPDYIITEPGTSVIGVMWQRLLFRFRRPIFILDVRSTPVETVGLQGYLKIFWFKVSVFVAKKLFDGITTITSLMRKEICDKFHIDSKTVGVWTSGVSTALFDPEKIGEQGIALRKKFGLTDKFIIFYHGNFGFKRGIIESVESIQMLKKRYDDLVFFLLGSGPAYSEIRDMVQKNAIQDKVVIHNPVDYEEVPKFVAMCDIGIVPFPNLPDWRHQCPIKVLEYLAMKKAVLLTDIPAHREIVRNNKCGIYMSSHPIEIAKSIAYAYKNKQKLDEWGTVGRQIVTEEYNWEKVATDLESYLLTLN